MGWSGSCGSSRPRGLRARGGRRAALAGVAGILLTGGTVVGLAGCSPDPAVTPSASTTPTLPAPMPSPAKPTAWSDNGAAGAEAAALWFVRDAYAYVLETNDTADWKVLSLPNCSFCSNVVKIADDDRAAGQVAREGMTTASVTRSQELNPLAFSVLVKFNQPDARVYSLDGQAKGKVGGVRGQLLLIVRREGPDWLLEEGQWFDEGVAVPTFSAAP